MTVLIPYATITKLSKGCSMFSSPYEAERATAAALADQIVKAAGLSWDHVLSGKPHKSAKPKFADTVPGKISAALACPTALTSWETNFVRSICGRSHLTAKQLACLNQIALKVSAYEAGKRRAA
jgi:hypothetical protein